MYEGNNIPSTETQKLPSRSSEGHLINHHRNVIVPWTMTSPECKCWSNPVPKQHQSYKETQDNVVANYQTTKMTSERNEKKLKNNLVLTKAIGIVKTNKI